METVKDRGAWARFWAEQGATQTDASPLLLDPTKIQAVSLEHHFRWFGEWYGQDLNVESTFSLFTAEATPAPFAAAGAQSSTALLLLDSARGTAVSLGGVSAAISLTQALVRQKAQPHLLMLTCSAQLPVPASAGLGVSGMAHSGVWGLGRTLRLEVPGLCARNADTTQGMTALTLAALANEVEAEAEVAWASGKRHAARLCRHGTIGTDCHSLLSGAWVLTGGLGGLALRAAALLLSNGALRLVLSSRSGRVARDGQGLTESLHALGSTAVLVPGDSGDASLLTSMCSSEQARGLLHAAGVVEDQLILRMATSPVANVFAAKAQAAERFHTLSVQKMLEALVLYSSFAATFGSLGVGNYAAANTVLDSLALCRQSCGLTANSLQPLNVSNMGIAQALNDVGKHARSWSLGIEQYAACLDGLLAGRSGIHLPLPYDMTRMAAEGDARIWKQIMAQAWMTEVAPEASISAPVTTVAAVVPGAVTASANEWQHHAASLVQGVVRELAGKGTDVDADITLMDAGIDSMAATELSSRLRLATGVELSPTIVFEQPTPRAIAAHLLEQVGVPETALPIAAEPMAAMRIDEAGAPPALICMVSRWPGGCNKEATCWKLQASSGDAVNLVPRTRWVLEEAVDVSSLSAAQATSAKHGGFVAGSQRFDARVFGISSAEAGVMDPQQRLLLEIGYATMHSSSHRRITLMGGDSGVLLAIERPDWLQVMPPSARGTVYALTGDNVSAAAGRVSFVLGLQGPCSSIDTACSSSVVATHWASHAVKGDECVDALPLAVSLKLVPYLTLGAAAAGMVSIDGRCKTFDARANGYVRSEGASAAVLRRTESTASALFRSSAVRQDGRSASLTAPNGSAQRALLNIALGFAGITPSQVQFTEAHGTGTALGDPTEMGGLVAVHGSTGRTSQVTIGSVKSSLGHGEAQAGQAEMLKIRKQLQANTVAGNAQLRAVNPLVLDRLGTDVGRFLLPNQEGLSITALLSGLSSFGYSGTIAHALMTPTDLPIDACSQQLAQTTQRSLFYRRLHFAWLTPSPMLERRAVGTPSLYGSPLIGSLNAVSATDIVWEHTFGPHELAFLRNHRVGKVPLLPGTCYIEFVRVVVVSVQGSRSYSLNEIAFQNIMFLDDDARLFGAPTVRLTLDRAAGRIAITSKTATTTQNTNATMLLQLLPSSSEAPLNVTAARALCDERVPGNTFYAATANDYRGEFHSLTEIWGSSETILSLVAYPKPEVENVHLRACAFLDGPTQAQLWWADHQRRPFFAAGVDSYQVFSTERSLNQVFWNTVTRTPHAPSETGSICMHSSTGELMVRIMGGQQGYFAVGWLEERRSRRHRYQLLWDEITITGATSLTPMMTLLISDSASDTLSSSSLQKVVSPDTSTAVLKLPGNVSAMPVLLSSLCLLQTCLVKSSPAGVWVVTCNVHTIDRAGFVTDHHAGPWGLIRSARTEAPMLSIRCMDVDGVSRHPQQASALALAAILVGIDHTEPEVAVCGATHVARLAAVPHAILPHEASLALPTEPSTQLLTGGTGGLGLLTAGWLAETDCNSHIVLASRSGVLLPEAAERLYKSGAKASAYRCDTAQPAADRVMLSSMQSTLPPLRSMWHTAGVLADGLVPQMDALKLCRAHAPKVGGAAHLHRGHAAVPLHPCVHFSSIAGLIGGAAQASYAAANVCLDALALCRRKQGRSALSIEWGPWAEAGMASGDAIASRMTALGMGLIEPWQGLSAMHAIVAPQQFQTTVVTVWIAWWEAVLRSGSAPPALLSRLLPRVPKSSHAKVPTAAVQQEAVLPLDTVLAMVKSTAGSDIDTDAPLMEAGIDSLGAVELRNKLQSALGNLTLLPSTLVFDHPTVRQLVGHFDTLVPVESVPAIPVAVVGLEAVLEMVQRSADTTVDADSPLMEAGVDSLGAVELRNQLQAAVGESAMLPSTLIFDHPTVRQLAAYLGSLSLPVSEMVVPAFAIGLDSVLEMVQRTAGGAVDADAPLMEAGIDSLGAVELRNQLQAAVGASLMLPSTLIFDHPTARLIAGTFALAQPVAPMVSASSQGLQSSLASTKRGFISAVDNAASKTGQRSLKNAQSDRLEVLLNDTPAMLAHTQQVMHNREVDLHPCVQVLPAGQPVGLRGKVCVIGGASRGIGQGIAVRFGQSGAKVCVLGRSDGMIVTGPGTLSNVVTQINGVGGQGLAVQCDLTKPEQIDEAMRKIMAAHDRVDVLVNNASALYPVGVEKVDEKRFDLMNHVCVRGTFLLTRQVLPNMSSSDCPHVLTVAPAPIADQTWMGPHTCYSATKIGMGMLTAAWSVEFSHVHFNTIWPHKLVGTFAMTNTAEVSLDSAVTVAHMADPAYRMVTSDAHGRFCLDSGVLQDMGIADRSEWQVNPMTSSNDIVDDFLIEPLGLEAGQHIEYTSLPPGNVTMLAGQRVLLVDQDVATAVMEQIATDAGALVRKAPLTCDVKMIQDIVTSAETLDAIFIGAGPTGAADTLGTDADMWEQMFKQHCKAPYFFIAKAMPTLRRGTQPRVVMVAPAPVCHPVSFTAPAVPCAVISQMRGLYVIGMAAEFDGIVSFDALWDGLGQNIDATTCLELLASAEPSGIFYAVNVEAQPLLGPQKYASEVVYLDWSTSRWLERALNELSMGEFARSAMPHLLPALRADPAEAERILTAVGATAQDQRRFMESIWLGPAPMATPSDSPAALGVSITGVCTLMAGQPASASTSISRIIDCGRSAMCEVPSLRWDAPTDLVEPVAARLRHCGLVHGCDLYDNAAFGVSPAETAAMDPQQRLLLETGYSAMHVGGFSRQAQQGLSGIFLGIETNDFSEYLMASPLADTPYAATGVTDSVACGRLSYVLGLQGPCAAYATACSAALTACHAGLRALQFSECTAGLVMGVNLVLSPRLGTCLAIAAMTSVKGRSHTFDTRADGYARGEACGGVALRGDGESHSVSLLGAAVRQDGRSASLTAPNGQSQKDLIVATLADASTSIDSLSQNEAHGTGTALGDPIEAGSLTAAVLKFRAAPLAVGGVKANIGHAEPAAGMTGLLKLTFGLRRGEAAPNAQLRSLNPHLGLSLYRMPCVLPVQLAVSRATQSTGGVSSFGYSGTIVHAVLCYRKKAVRKVLLPIRYTRHSFPWGDAPHPFFARLLSSTDGATVFHSTAGLLHELATNHVVQGRVIFPAAGYLEFARAATGSALGDVFFLQPLAVEATNLLVDCVIADGRFEIRSSADETWMDAATHCSGALIAWDDSRSIDQASTRGTACVHNADLHLLYEGFHALGLHYGPGYRTLLKAWRGSDMSAARLKARSRLHAAYAHPADLDDALGVGALVSNGKSSSATPLPFAVETVRLQASPGKILYAVRAPLCPQQGSLDGPDGLCFGVWCARRLRRLRALTRMPFD